MVPQNIRDVNVGEQFRPIHEFDVSINQQVHSATYVSIMGIIMGIIMILHIYYIVTI